MKLTIDQNNLLVIENPNIPQSKEYNYNVGGYEFSSFDKWLVIYHKKQFKIINLKDLWEKMWVIMIWEHDSELDGLKFDIQSCVSYSLWLFQWFSEITGDTYFFVPKITKDRNEKIKKLFNKWYVTIDDKNYFRWPIFNPFIKRAKSNIEWNPVEYLVDDFGKVNLNISEIINLLFWLNILYWNFNFKQWSLKSIKMQIPLFWTAINYEINFNYIINKLQKVWIFLKTTIQETNDGIVYQITSSDFELLQIFARFYEPIEKWLEISKYTDTLKTKEELVEFLITNTEIPSEWKSEVLNEIENWMIKVLIK